MYLYFISYRKCLRWIIQTEKEEIFTIRLIKQYRKWEREAYNKSSQGGYVWAKTLEFTPRCDEDRNLIIFNECFIIYDLK